MDGNNIDKWYRSYKLVEDFYKNNGRLPNKDDKFTSINLYSWLTRQLHIINYGEKLSDGSIKYTSNIGTINILTIHQIRLLNDINIQFLYDKKEYKKIIDSTNYYAVKKYLVDSINLLLKDYNQKNIIDSDSFKEKINYDYLTKVLKFKEKDNKQSFIKENTYINTFDDNLNILIKYIKENKKCPDKNTVYEGICIGRLLEKIKRILMYGIYDKDGNVIYKNEMITKEQLNKILSINIDFVNKSEFDSKKIGKQELKYVRTILNSYAKYRVLNKNKSIKSKEDVDKINKKFKLVI